MSEGLAGKANPAPFSLKRRLIVHFVFACTLSAILMAIVDIWMIGHLGSQPSGGEGHSFAVEVTHTLPVLLAGQIAILSIMTIWLYKLVRRSVIVPVLSIAGRIGGLRSGKAKISIPPEPIAEEIVAVYAAFNKHLESLPSKSNRSAGLDEIRKGNFDFEVF